MKRNLTGFLFLLCFLGACTNSDKSSSSKAESDIDAAREFIRSALDGKFDKARTFLLPDSSNIHYMDVAERNFGKADEATKEGYRGSSINIHNIKPLNDSTTILIYSNSFMNNEDTLRILKTNGQWLVDLKYLYEHDMDTMKININKRDTLK